MVTIWAVASLVPMMVMMLCTLSRCTLTRYWSSNTTALWGKWLAIQWKEKKLQISSTRTPGLSTISNGNYKFAAELSHGFILVAFLPQVIIIAHNRTCLKGNWKCMFPFSSWVFNLKPNATICIKYKGTAVSLLEVPYLIPSYQRIYLNLHESVLIHTSLNTPRWGWEKSCNVKKERRNVGTCSFPSQKLMGVLSGPILHPSFVEIRLSVILLTTQQTKITGENITSLVEVNHSKSHGWPVQGWYWAS